ncbi:MAG TPA: hypothetical protein PKY30_22180, partial [Myxococcota bacterium]|nr:hypothetical protein [Myxococcota bacterium]
VLSFQNEGASCKIERILIADQARSTLGLVPAACKEPGYSVSGDGTKVLVQMAAKGPAFLLQDGKVQALPPVEAEVVLLAQDGSIHAVALGELTADGMRALKPKHLDKELWVEEEVVLKMPGGNPEMMILDALGDLPVEGFARESWSLADSDWGDFGFPRKTAFTPENGRYTGWRRQNTEIAMVASEEGWSGPILRPGEGGPDVEWPNLDADPFTTMELRSGFLLLHGERDRLYSMDSYKELLRGEDLQFWPLGLPLPGGTAAPGAQKAQREQDYLYAEATASRTRGGRPGNAPPPDPVGDNGLNTPPPEGQPAPGAPAAGVPTQIPGVQPGEPGSPMPGATPGEGGPPQPGATGPGQPPSGQPAGGSPSGGGAPPPDGGLVPGIPR